jgi:ATP-dependent helicase YprA (DUF1998 family)
VCVFLLQALARDQLRTLLEMNNGFHIDIDVQTYDGDAHDHEYPAILRLSLREQMLMVCCAEPRSMNGSNGNSFFAVHKASVHVLLIFVMFALT